MPPVRARLVPGTDSPLGRTLRVEREAHEPGNLWRTRDAQSLASLVFARSRIYAAPVTMTKSPRRQYEERLARMLLRIMTYPIPLGIAFLIWILGFDVHPHRIVFACIVAACWIVFAITGAWLVYWARMRTARKL
jgi:hypothetical protein